MIDLGDMVHVYFVTTRMSGHPPQAYLSSSTNEPAIGIVIDMTTGEDDEFHYEVLIDGEVSWWSGNQVRRVPGS